MTTLTRLRYPRLRALLAAAPGGTVRSICSTSEGPSSTTSAQRDSSSRSRLRAPTRGTMFFAFASTQAIASCAMFAPVTSVIPRRSGSSVPGSLGRWTPWESAMARRRRSSVGRDAYAPPLCGWTSARCLRLWVWPQRPWLETCRSSRRPGGVAVIENFAVFEACCRGEAPSGSIRGARASGCTSSPL